MAKKQREKKPMKKATKKRSAGISKSGNRSEALFERLTGYERTAKRSIGDFIHQSVPIEVKKVTANEKNGNGTINQVRATKNGVLVIHIANKKEWIVMDAKVVLRTIASSKTRGQHTENPFESCVLSIRSLESLGIEKCPDAELKTVVSGAVTRTLKDTRTAALNARLLKESQALAAKHRKLVREALGIK